MQHWSKDGSTVLGPYDDSMLTSACRTRFAASGPGNRQIIKVHHLLKYAIIAHFGGGDIKRVTGARALRALGVLQNSKWHFWSSIYATSFTAVVEPMFKGVMENDGYKLPELARGEWKQWSNSSLAMLSTDGSLNLSKCGKAGVHLEQVPTPERPALLVKAAQHFTTLSASIKKRFGPVFDNPDIRPAGLIGASVAEGRAIATQVLAEFDAMSSTDRQANFQLSAYVSQHRQGPEQVATGSKTLTEDITLYQATVEWFDHPANMIPVESTFSGPFPHFPCSPLPLMPLLPVLPLLPCLHLLPLLPLISALPMPGCPQPACIKPCQCQGAPSQPMPSPASAGVPPASPY